MSEIQQSMERLYARVRSGLMDEEQGARALMETVFRNRERFPLSRMEGDELTDFLLHHMPRFRAVFRSYEPGRSSFYSFVYGGIATGATAWRRRRLHRSVDEESSAINAAISAEELEERYLLCEAPFEDDGSDDAPLPPAGTTLRRAPGRTRANGGYWRAHFGEFRRLGILVLALKCSASLTEPLIQRICEETGTAERDFRDMQEQVLESMKSRRARHDACWQQRDNAYFYRRRYMLQLLKARSGSVQSERLLSKYRRQDASWETANRRLGERLYALTPSNKAVAQALGITGRKVQQVLDATARNIDILAANQYHVRHENLLGYRQPEQKAGNAGNFSSACYSHAQRRRDSL